MDEEVEFSVQDLEKCSYRGLQQIAKSMQLPSNVKKIYLIQLIHAKKHCSEADVEAIVQQVRLERQLTGQVNKRKAKKNMRLQNAEVSSTNGCLSPPISSTPKRPGLVICNPFTHATFPRSQVARVFSTQSKSDRVLRSFNLNNYKRPRYFLNDKFDNAVIGVIKAPKKETDAEADGVSEDRKYPKLSLATKCIVRKLRPTLAGGVSCLKRDSQMLPVSSREVCINFSKEKAQTSPEDLSINSARFECTQSIGFRRNDGKISKINALVQKSSKAKSPEACIVPENSCTNVEVTIQDIINSNIAQTFTNTNISEYGLSDSTITAPYPSTSNFTEYSNPNDLETQITQNESTEKGNDPEESFAVYFHKKIRAEQVKQRMQRVSVAERESRLPMIGEAFTAFQNYSKDVTEPLYVQVSKDSERTADNTAISGNMGMLESLYNFKPSMLIHSPMCPIVTTQTTCTFSTPVCVTAVAQPRALEEEIQPDSMYEQDRQRQFQYPSINDEITRMCEYLRMAEQEITLRKYHEALAMGTSSSSLESQDMGPSATEMVEDAMELISQDGDYMERISMDVRMQCLLCSWAGPKIVLDLHVQKDHASAIVKLERSEWNITYRLGSLTEQPLWLSEVRQLDGRRYALSIKRETEWLLVSLSTLTIDPDPKMGSITIYNKVTGQPYTWEGPIQLLPTNMPYENDGHFLRVAMDELDLVPRNPELRSTNKVVGRLDLNDVYVIIFVKIS